MAKALAVVANSWVDLDVAFALELDALVSEPFAVELLEVLPCAVWGVVTGCVLQGGEFLLSDCLEQTDFVCFLEDVEVEKFELNAIILLSSHNFP